MHFRERYYAFRPLPPGSVPVSVPPLLPFYILSYASGSIPEIDVPQKGAASQRQGASAIFFLIERILPGFESMLFNPLLRCVQYGPLNQIFRSIFGHHVLLHVSSDLPFSGFLFLRVRDRLTQFWLAGLYRAPLTQAAFCLFLVPFFVFLRPHLFVIKVQDFSRGHLQARVSLEKK